MSTPDFSKLLDSPMEDAVRPPTTPAGQYHGVVSNHTFDSEKNDKATPFVSFQIQLLSPGDDIDPADLEGIGISKRSYQKKFWITDDAKYILREFLESMGVAIKGKSFAAGIPQVVGKNVLVEITHTPNKKDPTAPPYVNIGRISPDE